MTGAVIERPKMTRTMYQGLKRHILREREKKKQEQEQDEALEKMRHEQEMRRRKEEQDSLTLEQTKEQITQTEARLDLLKQEKHQLFSRLKKVLHQEEERRKQDQLKENELKYSNTVASMHLHGVGGHAPVQSSNRQHPMVMHPSNRAGSKYMTSQHNVMVGMKRPRSPSPSAPSSYTGYGSSKYSAYSQPIKQEPAYNTPKQDTYTPKQEPYPAKQDTYTTQKGSYASQPYVGHPYPAKQAVTASNLSPAAAAKYAAPPSNHAPPPGHVASSHASAAPGQSAFSSYASHYAHQQQKLPEPYPTGYGLPQRLPQQHQGYMGSPVRAGSNLPLQQQLEHANSKSGFSEDKFKLQQQQPQALLHNRMMSMQHGSPVPQPAATPPSQTSAASKPYPTPHGQAGSPYQTPPPQGVYSSQQAATPPRHNYPGQQRYGF